MVDRHHDAADNQLRGDDRRQIGNVFAADGRGANPPLFAGVDSLVMTLSKCTVELILESMHWVSALDFHIWVGFHRTCIVIDYQRRGSMCRLGLWQLQNLRQGFILYLVLEAGV